jgi:hypothetical protein
MKQVQKFAVLVFSLLLLAATALAASNKSAIDLTLNHQVVVNGTTLQPGDYKIVLERDGDNVQATFRSSGKTVATSTGHFEQRTNMPGPVSLVVGDKDRAVQQLLVQKMKGAVVFDNGGAAAAGH